MGQEIVWETSSQAQGQGTEELTCRWSRFYVEVQVNVAGHQPRRDERSRTKTQRRSESQEAEVTPG